MKRIELNANFGEFQAGSVVELEDDAADGLLKRGRGKLAPLQRVYGHIDEMPPALAQKGLKALEVADKAGGYREQEKRSIATAPFREHR